MKDFNQQIKQKGKLPLHVVDTKLSKSNILHANSVADFRQLNPDLKLSNRVRTWSQPSDERIDSTIKPIRNIDSMQRWSSSSNLDCFNRTGCMSSNSDDLSKKLRKMKLNENLASQPRRKLPITPLTAKQFDIKKTHLYSIS